MSRAKTAEEVREEFLDHLHGLVDFWMKQNDVPPREKLEGLVFSMLNIFDGTAHDLPAINLVLSPHPDDKQFCIDEDSNWYEPGQIINECHLHELWYKK